MLAEYHNVLICSVTSILKKVLLLTGFFASQYNGDYAPRDVAGYKADIFEEDRMKTHRKISNLFRELLKQELQFWQADGLISAEQSAALSQRYRLDEMAKESTNRLLFAIYIIGAVLIGAGVVSFVAAHWEEITPSIKVGLIVACMLTGHVAGFYLWKVSARSPRLGHALIVLGTLVFGANIGLMAQIFHIRSYFYNGLFAWAIGAIIMAYALESVPNAVIAILVSFIGFCGWAGDNPQSFCYYPFIAAAIFLPFAYLCRSVLAFSLSLLAVGAAVVVCAGVGSEELASFGLAAPGAALLFFAYGLLLHRTANFKSFAYPAMVAATAFIAFGAYLSSFHSYEMRFPDLLQHRMWLVPTICLYVPALVMWGLAFKGTLADGEIRLVALGVLVSCVLVAAPIALTPVLMSAPDSFWSIVFSNVACLVLSTALVINSFRAEDRRFFWAGVLFVALVIASRFFEYETGLLIKAVVFITCGVGLIIAGVGFENYLKKRRIANE
jgi:uncharacterized membrane protein